MKKIKVTRYKCDFCNKTAHSIQKMARHEDMCFKNPNRVCPCGMTIDDYDKKGGSTPGCAACECYMDWCEKNL